MNLAQLLTPMQCHVLHQLIECDSRQEVCRTLGIAAKTLEGHIHQALTALGVKSAMKAAVLWDRHARAGGALPPLVHARDTRRQGIRTAVLAHIALHPGVTRAQLAAALPYRRAQIGAALSALSGSGRARCQRSGKAVQWFAAAAPLAHASRAVASVFHLAEGVAA